MTKSFEEIVSNYQDPQPEWTVTINGKDYSNNIELIEFTDSVNNPLKVTVKLEGIDSNDNIPEDAEIIIGRKSGELFRGVLKEVNPNVLNSYTFKGAGYAAELESDSEQILSDAGVGERFEGSTIQTVVDTLVDGASMPNSRSFSTSYSGNVSSTVVDDFRVKKTQIEDVNRLMGEYDVEWYTTTDGSNNPVFNVTDQISFTDNGNPLDTITTYGGNQSAEMVEQNVNRNKGDFDGVLVRGYGDGDDQITATSGSTGKGNRVLIYTDKTILTDSQAQKRADNLADTQTVSWQEIEVKPSNPNKVYGVGDELKVDSKEARLNDTYRVVKSYFKIWPGEDEFESKLNLSNKPQTFIDDFKQQQNQTDSQTDYMQGSRNVWGDKEASNATNAEPLEIDFEVPQDVVDIAGNNRLDRIEFNYACTPYRQSGNPQTVTADNFNPSTKVVSTEVDPAGVEMERSNIKNHRHAVGSSTTTAASERPIELAGSVTGFNISSGGWSKVFTATNLEDVEDDLKHVAQLEITNITSTSNLHIALVGEAGDSETADFGFSPDSPSTTDSIDFFSKTVLEGGPGQTAEYLWDFDDSTNSNTLANENGYSTKKLGAEVQHSLTSSGDYNVTMEYYEVGGGDDIQIESTDAANNQIELSTSNNGVSTGDLVKVVRSSGNNGSYTVDGFTAGGGPNGGDLLTVLENVDEGYSSGDSNSVKGDLRVFQSPQDSVTKTVSVVSASSLVTSLEKAIAKAHEDSEMTAEKVVEQDISEEDVSTQAATIGRAEPDDDETYVINSDKSVTFEGTIDADDSGTLYLRRVKYEEGSKQETETVDSQDFFSAPNFDNYSLSTNFNSGLGEDPFQGPGEHYYELEYFPDSGDSTLDFRVEPFYMCEVEGQITQPADGATFNSSDVTVSWEGSWGEGVNDAGLYLDDTDGSGSKVSGTDVDRGLTFEVLESGQEIESIAGESHTFDVRNVDSDNQADITVDGTQEDNLTEGDTVTVSGVEVEIVKVTNNSSYKSVVFSQRINDSTTLTGLSDGDHTVTFIQYANDGNRFGSGSDFTQKTTVNFTVDLNDPPSADFSFSPSNPAVGEQVQFTDESTDPDGDATIEKWEWDFDGDGNYEEAITSSPGDTTHVYNSTGNFNVELKVTDDAGASDTITKTVSVQDSKSSFDNPYTVDTESVEDVGGISTSTIQSADSENVDSQATTNFDNAYTVDTESYNQVGTQQTPANDTYVFLNMPISQQYISNDYELYIATQGSNSPDIDATFRLWQANHTHDVPRQDDFSQVDADVGAGAENKEVAFERASADEGDVLLDFNTNNEAITLDTTLNGNEAAITVGNIDDEGNITNTERIPSSGTISNGTATSTNTYQDDELYVRIESANNKDSFEVRDQSGDDTYTLAAAPEERFRSAKTSQETEGVALDDGTDNKQLIDDVSTDLLAGSTANHVTVFIDDEPDSGSSSEREITGALYNGSSDSGKAKDKELSINQSFSIVGVDTGSEIFSVSGDQTSYMQSGDNLRVTGSTGNDGGYTISSVSYDSNNDETDITVNEDVTDSTADGTLEWRVVNDSGWYRLKIKPDQASFIKSRVFLDHHKDTQ